MLFVRRSYLAEPLQDVEGKGQGMELSDVVVVDDDHPVYLPAVDVVQGLDDVQHELHHCDQEDASVLVVLQPLLLRVGRSVIRELRVAAQIASDGVEV